MNAAQKHAWFNLAVIAATFLTVLALIPVLHSEPWAASDCSGCWGAAPVLRAKTRRCRRGRAGPVDPASIRPGRLLGVLAGVRRLLLVTPVVYGWRGAVPVVVVQSSVWVAVMLVVGVTSLATLVQYGRGGATDEA